MNRKVIVLIVVVVVLLCIVLGLGAAAFLSYQTTHMYWDGGYPAAEFRMTIVDGSGEPVPDAVMRAYDSVSGELAIEYPIYEQQDGRELAADAEGRLTVHQPQPGIQFGGESWDLFWVFPMGTTDPPSFSVEISAAGYEPLELSIWDLYVSDLDYDELPVTVFEYYGMDVEMPVFEQTFTLDK